MKHSFKQVYDLKNILKTCIYIFITILIVIIGVNLFDDALFGIILTISVLLIIVLSYFGSITKITLLDDGIELKSFLNPILLRYENIKEIIKPDNNNLKLLKKQYPEFSIFGKRGIYKTKQLENLFVYSCSNQYKDNLILHYGVDYYMISVENIEVFRDELSDRLKNIIEAKETYVK